MKKGISIPINTLVMLSIAVVVLLAVVAWFMLSFSGSSDTLLKQQAFKDCCVSYVSAQCQDSPDSWKCPATPQFDQESLKERAKRIGLSEDEQIKAACGCAEPIE